MGLTSILHKLANKVAEYNNSLFTYPVNDQKTFIDHFPIPVDNTERSFFQYKCQMRLNRRHIVSIMLNISSLPMLVYYWFKKDDVGNTIEANSVFIADGKPSNIVPQELLEITGKPKIINEKKELLTKDDRLFFKSLCKRYPFSWYFLLKCLINIRYYSYLLFYYNPKYIIVCHEYSFTSSILTDFCEKRDIEHINVMHGEKLYFMRDSFFSFTKCYVWDEYYIKLFRELRAKEDQFIIAVPPSLRFDISHNTKSIDYTYYLGAEKNTELKSIVERMSILHDRGFKVAIRPHPRYTDLDELKRETSQIEIENVLEYPIEQSLRRTIHAIAAYSTVLNQAYHNGVTVVIDDMTNHDAYLKLKELKYIMIIEDHILFSEVIESNR